MCGTLEAVEQSVGFRVEHLVGIINPFHGGVAVTGSCFVRTRGTAGGATFGRGLIAWCCVVLFLENNGVMCRIRSNGFILIIMNSCITRGARGSR